MWNVKLGLSIFIHKIIESFTGQHLFQVKSRNKIHKNIQ